jgi:hypothetical protein
VGNGGQQFRSIFQGVANVEVQLFQFVFPANFGKVEDIVDYTQKRLAA